MTDEPDIMTIREVAEYLRLTEKTTYRFALEGKIPGFKVGAAWRFRREDIVDWTIQQSRRSAA
ncbi:MAG: DNA-binding protein [Micavibrio sp.]|nr:DNA-binding protein [Micavibrio sp.]|tara:strand:+ start:838 stop:1026 length:189 start_codon:yes stop_codon:yes gene_type:complete